MSSLLPAFLLALFAAWCGSFNGGASFSGAAGGQMALLAVIAARGRFEPDPLRLGRAGRWLPAALVLGVLASLWASDVPRAGRVGVVLLPAFLLLPATVARCWAGEVGRRRGPRAVTLIVGGIALWALGDWLLLGPPRPAMPLGHHNLLAAWLAILAPLALWVGFRDPRAAWRRAALAVCLVAAMTVLLSGSLTGTLALLVGEGLTLAALAPPSRNRRLWAAGSALALVPLIALLPRLLDLLAGRDPSTVARLGYWQAGWLGLLDHPLLGRGPGSVPWTLGEYLHPIPGVHPPSEVVGQLHALPLELAYELGLPGVALAVATGLVFALQRLQRRPQGTGRGEGGGADSGLAATGLAGLAAGAVASLGNAWLSVTALPLALAVVAGAALAGREDGNDGERGEDGDGGREKRPGNLRVRRLGAILYATLAGALLLAPDLALRHYEAARRGEDRRGVEEHLRRAVELDPAFPLYRARLAWYGRRLEPGLALAAARGAPGVGTLWLSAGVLGAGAGEPWARPVLGRALALDPLGSLAPLFLAELDPAAPGAAACGARALLTDPRLGAALLWERYPDLLDLSVSRLRAWEGIDPGWRETVATAVAAAALSPLASGPPPPPARLAFGSEGGEGGLSLHAFRRRSWAAPWFVIPVRSERLSALDFPPAGTLPDSSATAFTGPGCSPWRQTP